MAETKSKEFKRPFILVAVLLIVIVGFIVYRAQTNRNLDEADDVSRVPSNNKFSGQTLDTGILEDEKFKELKPIPKYEIEDVEISEDELASVRRRYGNPFKPF